MDDLRSDRVEAMNPLGPVAKEAARALHAAFYWAPSAEGHDYWQRIYDRLCHIASLDKDYNGADDE